jgi:diguanylate cyclase (GGDEF)-like protein/PAS domain S-box-containing protein
MSFRPKRALTPAQSLPAEENEEHLAELSATSPGLHVVIDGSGHLEAVPPGIFELTGWPCAEFLAGQRTLDDIVHADDREAVAAARAKAFKRGESYEIDYRIVSASDETREVEERGHFAHGALNALLLDVTEQKRALAEPIGELLERFYLKALLANVPDQIYFKDRDSRFQLASEACARRLGRRPEDVVGKDDFDFFTPEFAQLNFDQEQALIASGEAVIDLEAEEKHADGHTAWVSTTKMPLITPAGETIGILGQNRDITRRKLAELSLLDAEARLNAIIATQQDVSMTDQGLEATLLLIAERTQALSKADAAAVLLLDEEEQELAFRAGSGRLSEYGALALEPPGGLIGKCLTEGAPIVRGDVESRDLAIPGFTARSIAAVPINYSQKSAGVLCVLSNESDVFDERDSESLQLLAVVVAAAMGQDELKRHAAQSEYQALHDALTGLPNRTLFYDRIQQALLASERDGGRVAIAIMDLDRFKEVNDTLGHASGDHVLQEIGRRLQDTLRASDTVARLGGDEYGLLLPKQANADETVHLLEKLVKAIEPPIELDGMPVAIEASIGVAFYPDHGLAVEELIQRADVAMYVAKQGNRPYAFYEHVDGSHDPVRLTLMGELRQAIDRHELVVHYQPKATLADGHIGSVEALVRWNHPERGLLQPVEFIPQAQETGLMKPLTLYVLDESLRQLCDWEKKNGLKLTVSVNLGTRNLVDAGFPDDVAAALKRWQIAPDRLELEITESTVLEDPLRTSAVIEQLNRMGVRLSIDDFGTGYSSLRYLRELPVNEIKIDRSFVMRMATDASDEAVVRSTIDLGRNLGLQVVAEGVESEQIWERLSELGCDVAQGFFLSRPVPADELAAWLTSRPES